MIDVFVINMKHRTDRLDKFKKNFDKFFKINVIEAVENKEGWKGCLQSHLKCIRYAKENNMKYIIVFEDDALPMNENIFEKFKKINEDIFQNKNDWDIFIGGSAKTLNRKDVKVYNSTLDLYNITATRNTHSIVYNNTSYDFFLNGNVEKAIDVVWYNKVKAIMPIPFLFTSDDSWSDITNTKLHIKNRIKSNEQMLINLLHINK